MMSKKEETKKTEYRISVRELVEFTLRSGDIDDRGQGDPYKAMLEGARIHRMIQKRQGSGYRPEVVLSKRVDMGDYILLVDGRADGVMDDGEPAGDGQLDLSDFIARGKKDSFSTDMPVIDEIKGTYKDLSGMEAANPLHLAQALCYAYFYSELNGAASMGIRLTYCRMDTMEIKYFRSSHEAQEMRAFFDDVIERYRRFADDRFIRERERTASIKNLEFPYPYRNGQKKLAGYVYRSIVGGKKLFLEAPTGAGKTLAVIYPALKALALGYADRIFYLTAKTIARTAPEQTFEILRKKGLKFRTVTLTAKEKICFMDEVQCRPDICPRAKGHFDRVNEALCELLSADQTLNRGIIRAVAEKYCVCPFELALDLTLFSDGVICDFNYAFDPFVYLRRFFTEGRSADSIFLVDEAHNLLDRGREMYSAEIGVKDISGAQKAIVTISKGHHLADRLKKCFKRSSADMKTILGTIDQGVLSVLGDIDTLILSLNELMEVMTQYMGDRSRDRRGDKDEAKFEIATEFYFKLHRFLVIAEGLDPGYMLLGYSEAENSGYVRLFCVDPSGGLKKAMDRAVSTVLFSATLIPIQYYKSLLGGEQEDYEAYAETVFSPERMGIFIAGDVTSRWSRRGEVQYEKMADYMTAVVSAREGNYLAFFPSFKVLYSVRDAFLRKYGNIGEIELTAQQERMTEDAREEFLSHFRTGCDEAVLQDAIKMEIEIERDHSVLGLCVLGGIFGEGVDLKGESLIGVMVIGTGIPQITRERELMCSHFDRNGLDGFDYAYRYPGMNRVLQAAGRLIRTEEDRGVLVLMDDRFSETGTSSMFPREWKNVKIVTTKSVKNELTAFWAGI